MDFQLTSKYKPTGDQPQAIKALVDGFKKGNQFETLLGVTGSGKTFTMANVIQALQKPTLIMSHNKTLAGQLYGEMKEFFPNNAVEYFVSYYDYYQPEAYIPSTDTYIAKDSAINDEIERLRLSATASLSERKDVIVVASVSCIYGLGSPDEFRGMSVSLRPGQDISHGDLIRKLIAMQYMRNDMVLERCNFRVRGDTIDIFPAQGTDSIIRVEFFGDEIDRICICEALTGKVTTELQHVMIYPASHYVVAQDKVNLACSNIEEELTERIKFFKQEDKLIEAQRISERTNFDVEMMRETGFCSGIENYSRHLEFRKEGEPPLTLLDFFPNDFLMIIDESHMTIPQIGGMFNGDRSRKQMLVNYGFRLPSALDNRPLNFTEYETHIDQMLFCSATPGKYEAEHELLRTEQVIRPTGLLDPEISVHPVKGQIDDLISEIRKVTKPFSDKKDNASQTTDSVKKNEKAKSAKKSVAAETGKIQKQTAASASEEDDNEDIGGKVLITTLTKRMAEDLTKYLAEAGIRVRYLHSDIDTLERAEIIRDMRLGVFDVLVGINLLREGLDIPEVQLVAIIDADKEGFLRSETSLIQTIGRAARNAEGRVIMYADNMTDSMKKAIDETNRRRTIQEEYNKEHGITPKTIKKAVRELIAISKKVTKEQVRFEKDPESMNQEELEKLIADVEKKMRHAATNLDFETAANLRDQMIELKKEYHELTEGMSKKKKNKRK